MVGLVGLVGLAGRIVGQTKFRVLVFHDDSCDGDSLRSPLYREERPLALRADRETYFLKPRQASGTAERVR